MNDWDCRAVLSNYFDDFWVALTPVNWTILSCNSECFLLMIHLYKVGDDSPSKTFPLSLSLCLDTTDLSRQLGKKMDIFNYYFSFLKLIGVWNKVSRNKQMLMKIFFSSMWRISIMEFITPNKFCSSLAKNYNAQKLLLKTPSEWLAFDNSSLFHFHRLRQSLYLQAAYRSTSRHNQVTFFSANCERKLHSSDLAHIGSADSDSPRCDRNQPCHWNSVVRRSHTTTVNRVW